VPRGLRVHFKTREEQIASFEDPKAAELLMKLRGIWEAAASDLNDFTELLRPLARLLAAASVAVEKEKQQKRSKA
jgi:hypothetical protein